MRHVMKEHIYYGGFVHTRAEVARDMAAAGLGDRAIDYVAFSPRAADAPLDDHMFVNGGVVIRRPDKEEE